MWQNAVVLRRLTERNEWKFFQSLLKADPSLTAAWWTALLLRGTLPAAFAIAMGVLVGAVQRGDSLAGPLAIAGAIFVLLQVLSPIHQVLSSNLGDRTAAWLYDRLTEACVRPPGIGHLEDPTLTSDLTVARDFDLGMTGPPLSISMDFIANGMAEMIGGIASAAILARYAWWAPIVLAGAWLATHWLLRESAVWRDRNTEEVRGAQRDADYAYRMAVEPPASKELRLFGLAGWTIDRFTARRTRLHELQYAATRLRERPVIWSMLLVISANIIVFWSLASAAAGGRISLGEAVVYVQTAIGVSMIAFGGFSWALDGAAAPVAAVLRLEPSMRPAGALSSGGRAADGMPAREIRLRDVTFAYPAGGSAPAGTNVLENFDLTIPAGSSLAIVGQNGAGKTTIAKLLCRLYDPQSGAIEIDGIDIRNFDLVSWRSRITAVFQDFMRLELPLRDNVAPAGAPDHVICAALESAGATGPGRFGHGPFPRLRRRYGSVRRTMATRRSSPSASVCQSRRRCRAPRRTDCATGRAGRGRDLRSPAAGNPALHDDPDLTSLFDSAPRRSHLRHRARQGDRARHTRRTHGAQRTLSDDVRSAGAALQRPG